MTTLRIVKFCCYLFSLLITICCVKGGNVPNESKEYMNEVLYLLENRSVNRKNINWKELKTEVFEKIKNAKTLEDTYPTVMYAVSQLKDNHSYFKSATEFDNDTIESPLPTLQDETLPANIGYIRVPFCIGSENQLRNYIDTLQTKISRQNNSALKGWIIDLRGNFGGNMWPMLLVIEPFIGNGIKGFFVDADNNYNAWYLTNGKAFLDKELVFENPTYKKIDLSNAYVAILTDNQTASSGEAIAVALKNRANSKSFGKPTFEVSTGCVAHTLSDGSVLNLAETVFADSNKKPYGYEIHPDVETDENNTLNTAINWIYFMNRNK